MSTNLPNPTIEMLENDPEVKSFIYQQIVDFEPYVTPSTVVAVMARDPRKLAIQLETDGRPIERNELKRMYRIAIVLSDGDAKIEAEGLAKDVYEAIQIAKQSLIARLAEIQDHVISQGERIQQINSARTGSSVH